MTRVLNKMNVIEWLNEKADIIYANNVYPDFNNLNWSCGTAYLPVVLLGGEIAKVAFSENEYKKIINEKYETKQVFRIPVKEISKLKLTKKGLGPNFSIYFFGGDL